MPGALAGQRLRAVGLLLHSGRPKWSTRDTKWKAWAPKWSRKESHSKEFVWYCGAMRWARRVAVSNIENV